MLAAGAPLVAAWLLPYRVVIQYQTVLALLLAPIILAAAVSCLRRYAPARYFTVAWSALLLGVMVYAAVSLGLLPKTPLTEYSMQIGSATEMILLSFALAYRINLLKAENERIQGEAREQLEARVRARTAELNATLGRLEDANRRLQDFSRRDGLTGLFNRRHLDDLLVQHCQQAREKVQPLSLLMLDMDHFKRINDLSGHLTGDDCLRAMAQLIERKASAVGGIAARYGGEEFAIVLPNTGLDATRAFAEELRADTRRLRIEGLATGLESLSVSIGLHASPPGYPCNAANMLRLADSALYAAKRGGRDRVEVASLV
jgi:diguanylate cyclase (GGDEF)-like protein